MFPGDFAKFAVALCKWFHNAYMIPEVNGPTGKQFLVSLKHTGYQNLYYRNVDQEGETATTWKTPKIGYWASGKSKDRLLSELERAVSAAECVIRSERAIDEFPQFIYRDGKIVHAKSKATDDESAKGDAHGDIVIALGCAWEGVKDRPAPKPKAPGGEIDLDAVTIEEVPYGSMAWRFKRLEEEQAKAGDPWG